MYSKITRLVDLEKAISGSKSLAVALMYVMSDRLDYVDVKHGKHRLVCGNRNPTATALLPYTMPLQHKTMSSMRISASRQSLHFCIIVIAYVS